MGLKFGQNIKFQFFFKVSAAFWSRQSFLVATLVVDVATYCCLSRHRSRHTAACRDTGRRCRDILLLVATSVTMSRHTVACRDILSHVATYFPDSSLFFFSNLSGP